MNLRQLPHRLLKSLGYRIFRSDTFYDSFIYYNRWGFPPDSLLRHIADASKIKTCIDAGANHGQTAIFLTDAFPGANIYSFEPVRSTFEILQTKVSHLPHVRTFNVALGESKGHVEIMRTEDDKRSSIVASTTDGSKKQAELVEVKTLDQFMQENGIQQVNWLKTDTEGYDLHVLKGAKEALSQGKVDFISSEVGFARSNLQNTYFDDVLTYLNSHGYQFVGLYDTAFMDAPPRVEYANALFVSRSSAITHAWR